MTLELCIPAFAHELVKLAFKLNVRGKAEVKAERHFENPDPDWKGFEKNLKGKNFREAVVAHPQADDKMKRYVKNFGGYLASKEQVAKVPSETSGRKYAIKKVGRRIACGCKDWQYKKSHGGGDCKHIKALKAKQKTAGLAKQAFLADVAKQTGPILWNKRRAANQIQLGRASAAAAKMHEQEEFQRFQAKS